MSSLRNRSVLGAAVAFVLALVCVGVVAGPASATPGDPVSFDVVGSTDFIAQTGTTSTETITFVNDGTDPIKFPARPAFTSPLALIAFSGFSGETILPGSSASLVVAFTAGSPGVVEVPTNVLVTAEDGSNRHLVQVIFKTESTVGPPLHFVIDPTTLDFGSVMVGASASKSLSVRNDGAVPLNLCVADIMFYDIVGTELPDFTITSSSLGGGCGYVSVGAQATFSVTYSPTAKTDAFRGLVAVTARYIPGEDVADTLSIDGVIAAAAVDPVVVPTPTPTTAVPAAPAAKPAGVGAAASATARQLAHTGAEPAFMIGFGTLTLALGGVALSIARSARRKARRG
ncbi:choice-of-anchor D domain-containing protein [Herbiconiux sp.]|uniref:choice-of-anchor D domain-containing protein n=1 Tax=Herbiconiux sp. TaxID=1871186 RepID=UPI0025BD2E32|nr:choice-of-anchor D domain-containing protein [Herbiconiux sp.]